MEEEHQAKSWRELFQKTTKLLYILDSVSFEGLLGEPSAKRYISSQPDNLNDAWKLSDGILLEIHLSTDGIISALKYFFEAIKIDESDYSVVLRVESKETPTKFEL